MCKHKIAIAVGSLRRGSVNRKIAESVCVFTKDVLDCEIVEISDQPLHNSYHDAEPPLAVAGSRDKVAAADGVVFVTPEYNPEPSKTRSKSALVPTARACGTRSLQRFSAKATLSVALQRIECSSANFHWRFDASLILAPSV